MLKPQDIVILLKIMSMMTLIKDEFKETLTQASLAVHLCMSASEVNAGTKRLYAAGLLGLSPLESINSKSKKKILRPIKAACEECLLHGVKYFFPVQLGTSTPGIATSYAAPVFEDKILAGDEPVPVWPYAEGKQRGLALKPLYRSVPESLMKYPDPFFYALLAIVDALRSGRVRERKIAANLLKEKLEQ